MCNLKLMVISKKAKDLKEVVMNPKGGIIKNPYYLITSDEGVIFVVSAGLNSIEYNKTTGFLNDLPNLTYFQCLLGQGILLLQRNDEQDEAKEFKVVTLSPGKQVGVPAGWGSVLVNIGKSFLVVLKTGISDEKYLESKSIMEKRGLAYYVVEKKGEIAFEQNPNYKVHPQITTE